MVARMIAGLLGFIIAMLFMRLLVGEARRARVSVKNNSPRPPKDAGRLTQDPATGIYYPVD
ncbi:MAG TPA: hypothetical protein VH933_17970 [Aestuariivirgaceae bacterium]